ncbi:MAG: hypothetical protein MI861_06300 [Pirellulales bacterium]|nr:hypothetical protein [Pirellulales bacterium]
MMKDCNRTLTCLGLFLLAACGVQFVSAQPPTAQPPTTRATTPMGAAGDVLRPCVLLRNDNVLFGTAQQQGEFVVVSKGPENSIRIPRKQVACWAPSLRHLYQYRVDHRRPGDLSAHLRDAGWCIRYDLYDLADLEIKASLAIAPADPRALRLKERLNRILAPAPSSIPLIELPPVQPVGHQEPIVSLPGVGPAALEGFASTVQPLLINRCGHCHSQTSNRPWLLLRPAIGSRASSRMTQLNLNSVLAYLNRDAPEQSELVLKATAPHGGGPAPLHPRHAKAIDALRHWIESLGPVSPAAPAMSAVPQDDVGLGTASASQADSDSDSEPEAVQRQQPAADPHSPARLPQVANPFDPDLFNRRYHRR